MGRRDWWSRWCFGVLIFLQRRWGKAAGGEPVGDSGIGGRLSRESSGGAGSGGEEVEGGVTFFPQIHGLVAVRLPVERVHFGFWIGGGVRGVGFYSSPSGGKKGNRQGVKNKKETGRGVSLESSDQYLSERMKKSKES